MIACILFVLTAGISPRISPGNHYKNKVLVLMYHHLDETEKGGAIISPAAFEAQIQMMLANDYHFISMDEFIQFKRKQRSIPDNAVLMTFDDGYESFYTKAYPILRAYDIPATKFVIGYNIDHPEMNLYTKY